ncbi:hypothetical protein KW803_00775 [Candidatus Saccharibacteria bacterium]|nr:hypothetical protein [Candidatus Saccharibacteria bacterium]
MRNISQSFSSHTLKRLLAITAFVSLFLLLFTPKISNAAIPGTVNFQGKVVNNDGTNVANGTYSYIFRLYNTASPTTATACNSDATCLFEETQSAVTVTNGVFQVELGSTCTGGLTAANSCDKSTAINFSTNSLYLTLKFNGDSAGFMSPTIHLTTVPYAFNTDALGGLAASNFVQLAQGVQTDTSTAQPSIFINKNNASLTPNIIELQKAGVDVLVINNSGGTTFTPTNSSGITVNEGTGVQFNISATAASIADLAIISNSGQTSATSGVDGLVVNFGSTNASGDVLHLIPSFAGGATDALTYNVFEVDAFSPTNSAGNDTVNGIKFGNLTDPGATITSRAISIGTGWDYGLTFNDTTPSIQLAATDNTADLSIFDNCSSSCVNGTNSPNQIFEIKDMSTKFGGLVLAGAFAPINSYWGEEYANSRTAANCTADTIQARGAGSLAGCTANTGQMSVDATLAGTGACIVSSPADAVGGYERLAANGNNTSGACLEYIGSSTANDAQMLFNSDNLPVAEIKVLPSVATNANSNARYFVGIGNFGTAGTGAATAAELAMDTGDSGVFFTNCSSTTTPTCTSTTWRAELRNGATVSNVDCAVTISTTKFAYMRIEVQNSGATPTVRVYVDGDVSDGVSPTACPAFSTVSIANLAWTALVNDAEVANTIVNLDVDYIRIWQDDAPQPDASPQGGTTIEQPVPQALNADSGSVMDQLLVSNFTAAYSESSDQSGITPSTTPVVTDSQSGQSEVVNNNGGTVQTTNSSLDLSVLGKLLANGSLVVQGTADFLGDVYFHNGVTFNNDSGGFATIHRGQKEIKVVFAKPKNSVPIVNIGIKNAQFANYAYKDLTKDGFAIVLKDPAADDIEFSWSAISVKDAKTADIPLLEGSQ